MTGFAKFTPLPLVELYVELQADEAEISQAYSYNILISTLAVGPPTPAPVGVLMCQGPKDATNRNRNLTLGRDYRGHADNINNAA